VTKPRWGLSSEARFRLALLGCALGTGIYAAGALSLSPGADLGRHVLLFLAAFAFYLVSVLLLVHSERRITFPRKILGLALLWAVVLRVALLFTAPSLSDDLFRYVWDGRVANAGISPYAYPPSAPELAHLRGDLWDGINHKAMATPYPPLAEAIFAVTYRVVPESLTAMQLVAVSFDLGVIAVLALLLRRTRMDRRRVLIYAWNPLIMVQYAHSGHFDSAMVLTLLVAIYLLSQGRKAASGLALGASVLVKLLPAMLAPLFLPLWGLAGLAAAAMAVALGAVPLLGSPALAGIFSEASGARFNDSAGYLLLKLFAPVTADPETAARGTAALILVAASLSLAWYLWRTGAAWESVLKGSYWLLGLYLLLNAVVEPWYLTWILPFLCFALSTDARGLPDLAPAWGWLLLSGLVMLTDLTYAPGTGGSIWPWVRAAEYVPLYLLLGTWLWRREARSEKQEARSKELGARS
jgi:hypothetical protein